MRAQQQDRDEEEEQVGADFEVDDEEDNAIGDRSLALLQREANEVAEEGVAGPAQAMPHGEAIQDAFGSHDVSATPAHVGGAAAVAADELGADGFETSGKVGFREEPDLHTAAHEAAHVVQQRGGAQLLGGLGPADHDAEEHADAVADRVVQGRSAQDLLDRAPALATVALKKKKKKNGKKKVKPETERNHRPSGMLAAKLADNYFRFWGFAVDSAAPLPAYSSLLTEIANLVNHDPEAKLQVAGHTSASGSEAHNFGLSMERAVTIQTQLAARGVNSSAIMPLGVGESAPLRDESLGLQAMAENRCVEVVIRDVRPKQKPPAPVAPAGATESKSNYIGCVDLEMMILLNTAEITAWTRLETGSLSTGVPRLGFPDDNVLQPSLADWRIAYGAEGVPDKIGEAHYDKVKAPLGANLLAKMNELHRQNREYTRMLENQRKCDPNKPLDPWLSDNEVHTKKSRIKDSEDIDRMPGDVDPKGREY